MLWGLGARAAAGCRCQMSQPFGVWVLVPLQGAAASCARLRALLPMPSAWFSFAIWGLCWHNLMSPSQNDRQ